MAEFDSTVKYLDVQGFPGYRVGNDGSVWSAWKHRTIRAATGKICDSFQELTTEWHQITPSHDRYMYVTLYRDGRKFRRTVHRLVLEVFVGPRPKGMVARHFPDRDPSNCALSNLQWGTQKENKQDELIHGTRVTGERHGLAKSNAKQVLEIRNEYARPSATLAMLAMRYGMDQSSIADIVRGTTWKHLPLVPHTKAVGRQRRSKEPTNRNSQAETQT
jgi:hypothetical protein